MKDGQNHIGVIRVIRGSRVCGFRPEAGLGTSVVKNLCFIGSVIPFGARGYEWLWRFIDNFVAQ